MSSVPVISTPSSVALSASSNRPPSSSVTSADTSRSSGVNSISSLPPVTTVPTSASVPSPFSQQSQPSSPASQITMSATPVASAIISSPADPSVSSSAVPLTSSRATSMPSATTSATIVNSSDDNRSTISTPKDSTLSTTSSTTTGPGTIQSPTLTSPPLSSTTLRMTASSVSILTITPDTPSTTTFLPLPPGSSPQSSGRPNVPITTVLQSTTIFVIRTNSQGEVATSIPPVVTEVITTTGNGGLVTTITQAIVNPTLAPNNGTTNTLFFNDTGAVVGVFVVVGLATASIIMWVLFAIRRRQRMKRIEQDTAVEAAVAAAGLNRAPLDDDDDDDSPTLPNTRHQFALGMDQRSTLLGLRRSGSLPTSAQFSAVPDDTLKDSVSSHPKYPVERRADSHPEGYEPARTTSPPPPVEQGTDEPGSSRDRKSSYGHTPTYSAGSFEPLLANYLQNVPDQDAPNSTMQTSQNRSLQHGDNTLALNEYSDGSPVGSRTSWHRQNSSDGSVLHDEDDDARYVLMVCNAPDDQSQHSL